MGGQNKVPRLSNNRELIEQLIKYLEGYVNSEDDELSELFEERTDDFRDDFSDSKHFGKIQIIEGISILYIHSALTSTCERPEVKFVPGTPGF